MAKNQKKHNTRDEDFSRLQRDKILLMMKDAWRNSSLFSKLYPNQQTAGTDAILLRFRHLHFDYFIKEDVYDQGEPTEKTVQKYTFTTTIPIIGTEDLKVNVTTEIEKDKLDKI